MLGLIATNCVAADLRDILREPKRYYHQKVSVDGIVRVSGGIYLFGDVAAAADYDVPQAGLIVQNKSPDRSLDRKHVRVVGTVLSDRGLDFRCAIKADSLEVLDPTPDKRIKQQSVTCIFRNALDTDVAVELSRPGHYPHAEFYVEANSVTESQMQPGEDATVSLLAGPANVRIDKRKKDGVIFNGHLPPPNLPRDYVYAAADDPMRRVYYQIVDREVRLTQPPKK